MLRYNPRLTIEFYQLAAQYSYFYRFPQDVTRAIFIFTSDLSNYENAGTKYFCSVPRVGAQDADVSVHLFSRTRARLERHSTNFAK